MATNRSQERVRFRYGMCLNDGCSKCKSKEVQQIAARKEFVCEECGKPLRECPPPKKSNVGKMAGIAAAAVVVLGGAGYLIFGGSSEPKPEAPVEVVDTTAAPVQVDSPKVEAPVVDEPKAEEPKKEEAKKDVPAVKTPNAQPKPAAPAAKNPSWGSYEGARDANGLPHGNGVLYIKRATTINGEAAQPGERIEGVFRNGYVNMGTWYKSDGNAVVVKGVKVV